MQEFRNAVERNDHVAVAGLLAEDVTFTSPVAFKPYVGKRLTSTLLQAVSRVFEDFRYVRSVDDVGGHDFVLFFCARIGDITIHGCDSLHLDQNGLIDDFVVMVRPLSAARVLADRMASEIAAQLGTMSG